MRDWAEENRKLRLVLDVARRMAVTTDLDVLLHTIVEAACRVLECERATIFLYDAQRNELYSRAATGTGEIRFSADRGIAGTVVRERQAINVPDAYSDARFNPDIDRRTGFRTRNILAFPLENLDGDLIGVLQTLNKRRRPFDEGDIELARVLSAQAGVAIQRWFLLEAFAQKQRMQRDMDIARDIQQGLFPKESPRVKGYEILGWNQPADETGGDAYDFIPLDGGRLAIVLADATGHGIGSALIIAQCRALIRAMLSETHDLARVATRVNALLAGDLRDGLFVTAFIGVLDPREHRVHYISAGQGPLMLVPQHGAADLRMATAPPLGVVGEVSYSADQSFDLNPGDVLVLLTDGFYEACDPGEELFGEDRVARLIQARRVMRLSSIIEDLHAAVKAHAGDRPQMDDLTAVLVRRDEVGA